MYYPRFAAGLMFTLWWCDCLGSSLDSFSIVCVACHRFVSKYRPVAVCNKCMTIS